jgi:hypothetical protein
LAGLLVILIYSADAYLKLHTKLICCRKLTDNIYLADDIDVPFVMGIWRPRIYLPSGIAKENLSYVIAHEQTHIKRQDPLKKGVAYIITGLHWFNPFAWAAFYFLCKDMETACDEETILALGLEHKQDYARVLLQIASGQKMFLGAPLAFGEGSVKSRIKHIVSFKKTWRVVSVLFKEDAFTAVNAGEISFAEENVPSMNHVRPTVVQRESAKSLAYDIQGKSLTYHVPKHTVALKSGELTWELYAYAGNGDRWIGTIYAGPTTEVEKTAGDAGIPKEKGAGVYYYEASLFSKAQQGSIDGRENVSALKNIRKKYTQEILVSKDGTEMIKVFMVDFD